MGLFDFLDNILGTNKKPDKKQKQKKEEVDWETHCENCGELLEDCVCDDKELSLEDICLMDMIDEDDEEDEIQQEDEEDDNLSFDDFESLDDDDDW